MQGAEEQPDDKGTVTRDAQRAQVVWIRTQAFAALLLAIVLWTTSVWIYRSKFQGTDHGIPSELVVDLNEATQAELNLLPGVGEKLADDILKYRDEVGAFRSVDELKHIRGIKEARLASLRKHVTVRGENDDRVGQATNRLEDDLARNRK